MPTSLTVTTTNLQSVSITIDGGTKPATVWKYRIERKENSQAASYYYIVTETSSPTYTDYARPRPVAISGYPTNPISWDYRVKAYIFGSGWDAGLTSTGHTIAAITDAQITSTGVLGSATSSGTFSNTYISQTETKPSAGTNLFQESLVVCEILPLTVSSV